MAEFVRQHGLDLAGRQARQQRVVEDHALGRAQAGEVGVGMGRAPAAVHHEQALGAKAAARHQRTHALGKRRIGQRRELVEERGDHGRVEHQHQQLETRPRQPGPKPPPGAGRTHQPQHEGSQRQADRGTEQRALGGVEEVELPGHAIEAEALLDAKGAPHIERHFDQRADKRDGGQQRELIGHATPARLHRIAHQRVERVQAAQQRPRHQHHGAEGHRDQPEATTCQRVVGRLVVRLERHFLDEGGGHRAAVGRHMAHLAQREPGLEQEARDDGGGEEGGQNE